MGRKKTVLLTGIGGNTAQGVARSLLEYPDEFRIIGVDSDRYNLLLGLRYVEKAYLVPRAGDEDYIDVLRKIIIKENVDVVIPSPDPEVYVISKYRDELDALLLLPSHRAIEIAQDKWLTYKTLLEKVGQPKTFLIQDYHSIVDAFNYLKAPVWIRKRRGAGGSKSFIAYTIEQADFWIRYWRGYGEFLVSELLSGKNLSWIGLYKDGELVASGGYLRIRYFMSHISPTGVTGNINVGVTIHDNQVNKVAEEAVKILDSTPNGIYTVDLKTKNNNNVDGEPLVTEINAGRFHMSFYVYTKAGLNLPYYYVKLALGEEVNLPPTKRNNVKPGVMTIRSTDNEPVILHANEINKYINHA